MRLVIAGPPGAGKGTQAKRLCEQFDIPHISTGEIFRKELAEKTDLGRLADSYTKDGNLVPDEIVIKIVAKRLAEDDCRDRGFLLDGFPRTIPQARAFDEWLEAEDMPLDRVIVLDVEDDALLMKRLEGRDQCPNCQRAYNSFFRPSSVAGKCDACGTALTHRKDDTPAAIKHRLEVDSESTRPIFSYYEERGLVLRVNGADGVEEITDSIRDELQRVVRS